MSNSSLTLRDRILKKHGTVIGFAKAAGIKRSVAYRVINREGCLLKTAAKVAAALDITLDELAQHMGVDVCRSQRRRSA